jgi:hypothetical protein
LLENVPVAGSDGVLPLVSIERGVLLVPQARVR